MESSEDGVLATHGHLRCYFHRMELLVIISDRLIKGVDHNKGRQPRASALHLISRGRAGVRFRPTYDRRLSNLPLKP